MLELTIFIILLFFGVLCTYFDIHERRVPNSLSFALILLAIILIPRTLYLEYSLLIPLIVIILFAFIPYFFKLWGAADGKIVIGIGLLLLLLQEYLPYTFMVNSIILYCLVITLFTLYFVPFDIKKKEFFSIPFSEELFLVTILFALIGLGDIFIPQTDDLILKIFALLTVLAIFIAVKGRLRKFFRTLPKDTAQLSLLFTLLLEVIFLSSTIWLYFMIIYCTKLLILYIPKLANYVTHQDGKPYTTPFIPLLFMAGIITLLTQKTFIQILIYLF